MAFIAAALIGGGAALVGSALAGQASKSAANTAANASNASLELQREMWQQGRTDQAPWLNAGTNALAWMTDPQNTQATAWKPFSMADYQQDPGYQFRLSEGLKALDHTAAARGGLLSGSTLKGAQRYGQDLASQEYANAYGRYNTDQTNQLARSDMTYNRNAAIAGVGQSTATNTANQAGNYGANAGAATTAAGQANAAGQLGQAAAWNNGINNAVSSYQQANMLNYLRPQPVTPTYGYAINERGW